jgi:hypothetical protein
MSTSDLISIIAVITTALVSIVSIVVSYFNNRMSIRAKRSEMALEKQLDAFREIAEKMGKIRVVFANTPPPVDGILESSDKFFSTFYDAAMDFYSTYQKFRVYLPSDIDLSLREYGKKVIGYAASNNYDRHKGVVEYLNLIEPEIIKKMNKYMGIN